MKRTIAISIPQPCDANWDSFRPTTTGGFCGQCQTNVVDFTTMTDAELLDFLSQSGGKVCGRYRMDQLKTYTLSPLSDVRPGMALLRAGVLGLLMLGAAQAASARTPHHAITSSQYPAMRSDVAMMVDHKIRGVVKDENGQPLPGVNILLQNTTVGTTTDADGAFEFPRALKAGDVLLFSYIGFRTEIFTVKDDQPAVVQIDMKMDMEVLMGAVAVHEVYESPSAWSRFWGKVKQWF